MRAAQQLKRWLKPDEAANLLKISFNELFNMSVRGDIEAFKLASNKFIYDEDVIHQERLCRIKDRIYRSNII